MASRLIAVVPFTAVGAGEESTAAHQLNINGVAVEPDYVSKDNGVFEVVTVTTTQITVRNNGTEAGSCNFWCERKHSITRALADDGPNLTPQPFIPADVPPDIGTLQVDRITNRIWATDSEVVRYIRSATGDDANDGTTEGTAWATLNKGLAWLAVVSLEQSQVLDIAGTFTSDEQINLGYGNLGSVNSTYNVAGSGPDNFIAHSMCQIRSAPVAVVTPIAITGVAPNATSGLYTSVTITNNLVASAHKGSFLIGSGIAEWAVIQDNGVNSLSITTATNPQTWTAPIGIYTYGATIAGGDPADSFSFPSQLMAYCDWFITGVRFTYNTTAKDFSLTVGGTSPVYLQLCDIEGIKLVEGGTYTALDACYVHDEYFSIDGGSFVARNSYFNGVTNLHHGSGVFTDLSQCYMEDHIQPFGGGVIISKFNFSTEASHFVGGTVGGVRAAFGNSRMTNCVVSSNTGAGVTAADKVYLILTNVDGTGNTTYGIELANGATVKATAATSVTGNTGDIFLGGTGLINYAAVPTDDLGAAAGTRQLVRITNA